MRFIAQTILAHPVHSRSLLFTAIHLCLILFVSIHSYSLRPLWLFLFTLIHPHSLWFILVHPHSFFCSFYLYSTLSVYPLYIYLPRLGPSALVPLYPPSLLAIVKYFCLNLAAHPCQEVSQLIIYCCQFSPPLRLCFFWFFCCLWFSPDSLLPIRFFTLFLPLFPLCFSVKYCKSILYLS